MKRDLSNTLSSDVLKSLVEIGGHIRIARTRRRQTAKETVDRIGVSVPTLRRLERGDPSVSMGAFASALWVLGLLDKISDSLSPGNDALGTAMEVGRLPKRVKSAREADLDDK
jgi:transcriptional regulator with XRE-family HTH domain